MQADRVFELSPKNSTPSGEMADNFFERLDRELRPRMIASLESRGASRHVAEDIVSEVLSECMDNAPQNLLGRFKGEGALDGWLLRVAINRLISRHRRERLLECVELDVIDALPCENSQEMDRGLQAIVSKALREAIESLPAEARLLLWLRHGYEIPQNRLCVCWQSTPSRISRALSSAREAVRERALRSIQREEPGLKLNWVDISGVCATSNIFPDIGYGI